MKPADVKVNPYIDSGKKVVIKNLVGDHGRISRYKNIFSKGCIPNWF